MTGGEIKKKALKYLLLLVLLVAVIGSAYFFIVFKWSYSKGERIGYVQKFSEKGWLCKTWEGELQMLPVPGAIPEKFLFSVRDKAVVDRINSYPGRKVSLYYEQHIGIPTTCFGESEYFIVDVKTID